MKSGLKMRHTFFPLLILVMFVRDAMPYCHSQWSRKLSDEILGEDPAWRALTKRFLYVREFNEDIEDVDNDDPDTFKKKVNITWNAVPDDTEVNFFLQDLHAMDMEVIFMPQLQVEMLHGEKRSKLAITDPKMDEVVAAVSLGFPAQDTTDFKVISMGKFSTPYVNFDLHANGDLDKLSYDYGVDGNCSFDLLYKDLGFNFTGSYNLTQDRRILASFHFTINNHKFSGKMTSDLVSWTHNAEFKYQEDSTSSMLGKNDYIIEMKSVKNYEKAEIVVVKAEGETGRGEVSYEFDGALTVKGSASYEQNGQQCKYILNSKLDIVDDLYNITFLSSCNGVQKWHFNLASLPDGPDYPDPLESMNLRFSLDYESTDVFKGHLIFDIPDLQFHYVGTQATCDIKTYFSEDDTVFVITYEKNDVKYGMELFSSDGFNCSLYLGTMGHLFLGSSIVKHGANFQVMFNQENVISFEVAETADLNNFFDTFMVEDFGDINVTMQVAKIQPIAASFRYNTTGDFEVFALNFELFGLTGSVGTTEEKDSMRVSFECDYSPVGHVGLYCSVGDTTEPVCKGEGRLLNHDYRATATFLSHTGVQIDVTRNRSEFIRIKQQSQSNGDPTGYLEYDVKGIKSGQVKIWWLEDVLILEEENPTNGPPWKFELVNTGQTGEGNSNVGMKLDVGGHEDSRISLCEQLITRSGNYKSNRLSVDFAVDSRSWLQPWLWSPPFTNRSATFNQDFETSADEIQGVWYDIGVNQAFLLEIVVNLWNNHDYVTLVFPPRLAKWIGMKQVSVMAEESMLTIPPSFMSLFDEPTMPEAFPLPFLGQL